MCRKSKGELSSGMCLACISIFICRGTCLLYTSLDTNFL